MKIDGKISGAVHRIVFAENGPSYTNPKEEVIELRFRSSADSNSTNCIVISKEVAKALKEMLEDIKVDVLG